MSPRWTWFDKASATLAGVLAAGVLGLAAVAGWHVLFPVSRWYELASVTVADTFIGQTVTLRPSRTIRRDFDGPYFVAVYKVRPGGARELVCSGNVLPESVTLDWWTAGAEPPCQEALGVGRFVLITCVNVSPFALPWRDACAESPAFDVKPRGL